MATSDPSSGQDASSASEQSDGTKITMLYFASARTTVNLSSEILRLPSTSTRVSDLPAILLEKHEQVAQDLRAVLAKSAFSVNEEIVYDLAGTLLHEGDTVAIIPPVSGG